MLIKPYLHSILASGYIFLIALFFSFMTRNFSNEPDTFLAPVMMLSLLTLSVAVMAYLFFYYPAALFVDGKKKQAFDFFVKTVSGFAAITLIVIFLFFTGIFS